LGGNPPSLLPSLELRQLKKASEGGNPPSPLPSLKTSAVKEGFGGRAKKNHAFGVVLITVETLWQIGFYCALENRKVGA
jgi:hypothetical protein